MDVKIDPKELADKLTMVGLEVESIVSASGGDTIFDVNVTPNRGDCLSVIGISREVAAVTNSKIKITPLPPLACPEQSRREKGGQGGFNDLISL